MDIDRTQAEVTASFRNLRERLREIRSVSVQEPNQRLRDLAKNVRNQTMQLHREADDVFTVADYLNK